MSYEVCGDPGWSVRYSKGDEEREERLVNIYDSLGPAVGCRAAASAQDGARAQKPPAVHTKPYRAAVLVLGVLGVLLLVGLAVLTKLYISAIVEKTGLQSSSDTCSGRFLQTASQEQEAAEWKRFGSSCYYRSAEMKDWTDSRTDCRSRRADLVVITSKEEQEFVSELNEGGASWIGLSNSCVGWSWVDGSAVTYMAWKVGVNAAPMNKGSTRIHMGYMDPQGHWNHTENGSKQWICERSIL